MSDMVWIVVEVVACIMTVACSFKVGSILGWPRGRRAWPWVVAAFASFAVVVACLTAIIL